MARLGVALAGVALGAAIGGPFGAALLGARIGLLAGTILGTILFPGPTIRTSDPKLEDRSVQTSTLGVPVPRLWGTFAWSGNLIWAKNNELQEEEHSESIGGKGGPSQEHTTVEYFFTGAIGLCEGEIDGILRVEANEKVIADYTEANTGPVLKYDRLRIRTYLGDFDQLPDTAIEADLGVDDAIPFRGLAYMVIEDLPLKDLLNAVPQFRITATKNGGEVFTITTDADAWSGEGGNFQSIVRYGDGNLYSKGNSGIGAWDPLNKTTLLDVSVDDLTNWAGGGGNMVVNRAGTRAYVEGSNNNAGRIIVVELPGVVYAGEMGFAALTPDNYEIARPCNMMRIGEKVDEETGEAETIICCLDAQNKICVFNAQLSGCVGQIASSRIAIGGGSEAGEFPGYTIGWPAIDTENVIYVIGVSASSVNLRVFRMLNVLQGVQCLGATIYGNADFLRWHIPSICWVETNPPLNIVFDLSDEIVDFGGGSEIVQTAYVEDMHAVLFILAGYAYLIDIESRTIIGPGLQVISGTGNTRTAMLSGVADNGLIMFKDTSTTISVLDVRNWTVERSKYDVTNWGVNLTDANFTYLSEFHAIAIGDEPAQHLIYLDKKLGGSSDLQEFYEGEMTGTALDGDTLYDPAEVDGAALAGDTIDILIGVQTRLRDIVEPVAHLHSFDAVEIDGAMKAVLRGQATNFTIPQSDLGAYPAGGDRPLSLLRSFEAEEDLPLELELHYAQPSNNYRLATQVAQRTPEAVDTDLLSTIRSAEAFTDDQALQRARRLLLEIHEARRRYEISVPGMKYLRLDPSDRGLIGDDQIPARIVQSDLVGWVLNLKLHRDRAIAYDQSGITGVPTARPQPVLEWESLSRLFLFDAPRVRDQDEEFGFYAGAGPVTNNPSWPGAGIFSSSSRTGTFTRDGNVINPLAWGISQTALPSVSRWQVRDRSISHTIVWFQGLAPVTVDEDTFLAAGSAYYWGKEVVFVKSWTDNGDGTYTANEMLRGRLGTEDQINQHAGNEVVARMDQDTWRRVATDILRIDTERYFKVTTFGQTFPSQVVTPFTNTGRSLDPYSPYFVRVNRETNGDLTIRWARRSRDRFPWELNYMPGLGEDAEEYELDLRNPATGDIVRTVTGLTSPTYTYTRADQISDGIGGVIAGDGGEIALPLLNPSFEADGVFNVTPSNWNNESASGVGFRTDPEGSGRPDPIDGGVWMAVMDDLSGTLNELASDLVDLVAAGVQTADLDASKVVVRLTGHFGDGSFTTGNDETGQEGLRFWDNSSPPQVLGEALAELRIPLNQSGGGWEFLDFAGAAPSGTRQVQVLLKGQQGVDPPGRPLLYDGLRLTAGLVGPANVIVDVYQISAAVGRGIVRQKVV